MDTPAALGLIAGSGVYPLLLATAARAAGVQKIVAAAFTGETDSRLAAHVDDIHWMRVGQLSRMISCFRDANISQAIMAGQIAPKNLFDLRPDWKALLLLARLERRNAESIFAGIAGELANAGVTLLPATTFLESDLAPAGVVAGRELTRRQEADILFGFEIAKEISRLDIGQTVIVKGGTVLAVEGFDGTNATIKRGGALGGKNSVMVKVAKGNPDVRFDVPVIGVETIAVAAESGVRVVAVEAERTLLLDRIAVIARANETGVTLVGRSS